MPKEYAATPLNVIASEEVSRSIVINGFYHIPDRMSIEKAHCRNSIQNTLLFKPLLNKMASV